MQSYIKLFAVVILICLVSVGFAQETAATPSGPGEAETPPFPYMAEITGDNLYVRSGPGTNFYECGKLNKGDKVKVMSRQFSWACIVPPAGAFPGFQCSMSALTRTILPSALLPVTGFVSMPGPIPKGRYIPRNYKVDSTRVTKSSCSASSWTIITR